MSDAQSRFFARSASDRTDDWPFWFVADRAHGGLNVTAKLVPAMRGTLPFMPRLAAEELARCANAHEMRNGAFEPNANQKGHDQ